MKFTSFNYDLVRYIINNCKLNTNDEQKVILIADMHDYSRNKEKSDLLAETIKKRDPHHIIIAGDNIQGAKWENERAINDFSRFVDNVSEVTPVFISQGNHDLVGINKKNKDIRNKNFKNLEKVRPGMIYPLINDKVIIDGFEIIGYTPDPSIVSSLGTHQHGLAHDRFIQEYMKNGIKLDKNNKNIVEFVGHNPYLIAQSENGIGLDGLIPVDVFYAGHSHNGYRRSSTTLSNPDKYLDLGYIEKPYSLDKNGKFIKNSINPILFGKTNLCRGVVYVNDMSEKKILQLSNNHFYKNTSTVSDKQIWTPIQEDIARNEILSNKLHALIITGGIRKFFGLDIPGDNPEITEIIYKNNSKK